MKKNLILAPDRVLYFSLSPFFKKQLHLFDVKNFYRLIEIMKQTEKEVHFK